MPEQLPEFESGSTVPYATPARRVKGASVWAGAVIALVGLGLIVLGGCFLIGVLCAFSTPAINTRPPFFVNLLYTMAMLCFGAGTCLLFISVRRLLEIAQRD